MKVKPYDYVKRALDIVLSGAALIVLSPVLLVVALLVRQKLGSPVLFAQERPGKDGKIFTMYKFRTMLDVDEEKGLITNEQRLIPFGKTLRSMSLDELPSLINVFKGEMSLVGPRPLRAAYLSRYTPFQSRRHEVKPGVTGLAQVSGRNALTWEARFEKDVFYVDNRSFLLDVKIIFDTFRKVIKRDGISENESFVMSAFIGQPPKNGVIAKPLEAADLPQRVEWLSNKTVAEGISLGFEPNLEETIVWFQKNKNNSTRADWTYFDEEHNIPIGMAGLAGIGSECLELYIYVNPEQHGKGYGTKIMEILEHQASAYGAMWLTLETKEDNKIACGLYERRGFSIYQKDSIAKGKIAFRKELLS